MRRIFHFSLVLLIIATISSGTLAVANNITKSKISAMDKSIEIEARKKVLPNAVRFEEKEGKNVLNMLYVPGYDNQNNIIGYVVAVDTVGYGQSIKFVLGIDMEGKITGLKITDASKETPGLGDKIKKEEWQKMWIGRDINYEFKKEVDGFAGATISPKGVYSGIKKALQGFETIKGGK